MNKSTITALFLVLALASTSWAAPYRTFTSKRGKTIEAKMTDFDETRNTATLQTRAGKPVRIKAAGLSREDQEYILAWKSAKAIGSPGFNIEAKKKTLEKYVSDIGSYKTEEKEVGYEVSLENRTRNLVSNLKVNYIIFYTQKSRYSKPKRGEVHGKHTFAAVPPNGRPEVLTTKGAKITEQKLEPGWVFSSGGGRRSQEADVHGIWLRFYLGDDPSMVHEVTFPDDLQEKFNWSDRAPLNDDD